VIEARVASAWCKTLGISQAQPTDNFFASGGQSLTVAKLAIELSKEFGRRVSLRTIYDHPTLEELTAYVSGQAATPEPRKREAGTVQSGAPLTPQQASAFNAHLRDPGYNLLNAPAAFLVDGTLDHAMMAAALRMIVQRHEALRTTFQQVDGAPQQVVTPAPRIDFKVADLPEGHRLADLISGEVQRPFKPGLDLPMRVHVWRLSAETSAVLFIFNHMCVDGWSVDIIVREFCAAYAHLTLGRPLELPAVGAQQADFARWQSTIGDRSAEQVRFWLDKWSDGFQDTVLPVELPGPQDGRHEGASIDRVLSAEDTKLLVEFARANAVSPFAVLLAAWHIVLMGTGGPSRQFLRIATANRSLAEFENTVGWFSHGLLVHLEAEETADFAAVVRRAWGELEDASSNQDIPLEVVVGHLTAQGRPTGSPVGSCTLTLQPDPFQSLDVPGLRFRELDLPPVAAAKRELSWYFFLGPTNLRTHIVYSSSSYRAATVQALFDDLSAVVCKGCQNPGGPVAELAQHVRALRADRD
jgi:acyl carrier protein